MLSCEYKINLSYKLHSLHRKKKKHDMKFLAHPAHTFTVADLFIYLFLANSVLLFVHFSIFCPWPASPEIPNYGRGVIVW